MFDNNFKTIATLLHSFKSKASTCLAVILFGALAIPALAQGTPPAASANCTVTAMNRTAPLQGDYGFTIYNIPGGAAFVGPGTPAPAVPFRVRAAMPIPLDRLTKYIILPYNSLQTTTLLGVYYDCRHCANVAEG